MKTKLVASIVFALSAWLAWGAGSLHEKDPAHYSVTPMLVLGALALVSLVVLFFGKPSTAKAKARS
ncbi:hypothetical protein [Amycolatopsis echigonensis]|uniref:Uncharacterized protein n=1 Tax=Amycolatopsis echigonensis TaxID=2576905 RepID=A0A2N3WEB0_9PSEU|nr:MULTISPECIES: hypothetical protein [Amycolatopsis]MBB2499655.1 hypothetical protein [Amycolatopsis echigonensis]PKV92187.1 hypothetical protein ATK30_2982 [Amycolatopsis niigatensis]